MMRAMMATAVALLLTWSYSAAAHELFAALRWFDDAGAHTVWLEQVPTGPQWEGVRDRIARAAAASLQHER